MDPTILTRNNLGLILGVNYVYREDGLINWRAMVKPEHLYINPQRKASLEKRLNKPFSEIDIAIDKLEDSELVILLSGIRYLLGLRGYSKLELDVVTASRDYAAVKCSILFDPNFETGDRNVLYSAVACAHFGNTRSFGQQYLVEMASNRAMCRTVRNFLNIDIVSKEELGESDNLENPPDIKVFDGNILAELQKRMIKFGYTVDQLREKIATLEPSAKDWSKLEDFPTKWMVWCIERIDAKKKNN